MKKHMNIFAILILALLTFCGIISLYLYLPYWKLQQQKILQEQKLAVDLYKDISYPNKSIGSVNLTRMNAASLTAVLQKERKPYDDSTATLQINNDTIKYTMKDLGQHIYYKCSDGSTFESGEENALAQYIISIDKKRSIKEQYDIIKGNEEATTLKISIQCECREAQLDKIIRALSKKYDVAAENSRITSSYVVLPAKEGCVLDTQTIAKELRTYLNRQTTKNFSGGYKTTKVKPVWYPEDLKKVNTLIARHATTFKENTSRGYNIRLAASRLNGVCLLPGEDISFLDVLYNKKDKKSYKKSDAFFRGDVVQAEGGGICQVSTTAYHTFLLAGILPEKRYPHSMPVGYSKLGLDAALSVGGKDLVIRNTLDVPILILSQTKKGTLAVAIQSYQDALKGKIYRPRSEKITDKEAKTFLDVYVGKTKQETISLSHDTYN